MDQRDDNVFIGYKAGQACGDMNIAIGDSWGYEPIQFFDAARMPVAEIHLRADDTLTISDSRPNGADAPAFCHCDYCGSKNSRAREECRSCRAPLPERTARVRETETTFKGVPLSELTEAELRAAAKYMLTKMSTSPADINTICDRWEELYGKPPKWSEMVILKPGVHYDTAIKREPQPRPALHPVDTFGTERTGGILQRLKKMVGLR